MLKTATLIASVALAATAHANAAVIVEQGGFWALGSGLSETWGLTPPVALADFNPDLGALQSATVEITGSIWPTVSSVGAGAVGPPPYSVTLLPTVYLRVGATGDQGSGAFYQTVTLAAQTSQDPLLLLSPFGASVRSELIDVRFNLNPAAVTSSVPFSGDLSGPGVYAFGYIGTAVDYTGFYNLNLPTDDSYGFLTVTVTYTYDPAVTSFSSLAVSDIPEPSTALLMGPVLLVLRRIRKDRTQWLLTRA